jgi:hypothetical protein
LAAGRVQFRHRDQRPHGRLTAVDDSQPPDLLHAASFLISSAGNPSVRSRSAEAVEAVLAGDCLPSYEYILFHQ